MKIIDSGNNFQRSEIFQHNFEIPDNHVHLWLAPLNTDENIIEKLITILSDDERLRADRLQSIETKKDFITARALLRCNHRELPASKSRRNYI